ncbi:MAG: RNA polymerase sigma factor [Terriglobia bacterium]
MTSENFSKPGFLERLRARDRSAVEELVNTYLPQILRAARGMGFPPEESEDLAQSVFLALIESLENFQGWSHIRTFIFGIFYNKVSEHLRFKQRTRQEEDIDTLMESRFNARGAWRQPPADLERELLSQEIGAIIRDCLEQIPQAQRLAFILREVEEMTSSEICKVMNISPTNLGVLMFRARNRLRECVERKGLRRG